ncbi:MAG: hypothetical protein IRZ03_08715 [Acidobacterium ailaaui]|nr:hypothetical protein [Pseudacidobacterium ailaaui]
MSLRRIGKLFAANNLGQIITVLTQLLLPPAFLHAFGESLYGQWLALSAAISYLITFNYGLQTYTNMQNCRSGIAHHGGLCYWVFRVDEVRSLLWKSISR